MMKPEELKGVLESLYGGKWDITYGLNYTCVSDMHRNVFIYLKNDLFKDFGPYIYIYQGSLSDEEYKEMTSSLTTWRGLRHGFIFDFDKNLITKLSPILSRLKELRNES